MRNPTCTLLAATLVLLARPAMADVQVTYLVEDKPLKAAVSGTALTIELFSDPTCTTAVTSVPVMIDDVDLVERLKRFKPKGGAKAPATARLTEAVTGVAPPTTLFASITGTGITPIGGPCQLQYSSTAGTSLPCATQVGNEVYFTGCNVNVRNGTGQTHTKNALGNLIVGYDDDQAPPLDRSGSHNLVVGARHTYSSTGGFVAGSDNTISGQFSTVSGGYHNEAFSPGSAVTGGEENRTVGIYASIAGGFRNRTNAGSAFVAGGKENWAHATFGTINGGACNTVGGASPHSCIAAGTAPVVTGGFGNLAEGEQSVVVGGRYNHAFGAFSSVGGGNGNLAAGTDSSVSGGRLNRATGSQSTVGGGYDVTSSGQDDWDAGRAPAHHSDF